MKINEKVLVTGSSGTIGTGLCEYFIKEKIEFVGIDRVKNRWNNDVDKKTIYTDLREPDFNHDLLNDVSFIVHLAANARVFNLVQNPQLAKDNFTTVFNISEFARMRNLKKIIFASSREVYGNTGRIIHNENESYVRHCESPYTATKIAGEALLHSYKQCYDIDSLILRFSNVFGRYDYSDRVIPLFILKTLKNNDITIYGKGKLFDFTYVDDAISGIIASIEQFEKGKNEVFNIATGKGNSLEEISELIKELTASKSIIKFKENRAGEVCQYIADIQKARAILGYKPRYEIDRALTKTFNWYKPRIDEYEKVLMG